MGIRDFLNNMFGNKEKEQTENTKQTVSSMGIPIEDYINARTIYLRDIEDTNKHFLYANGEQNTIYKAVLWRTDGLENEMLLAAQSQISFELPVGMSIDEAIQNGIISNLLNSGRAQEQNLRSDRVNHLGKVNMQTGIVEPSHNAVEKWVEDNLTSKLRQIQEERRTQDAQLNEQRRREEEKTNQNINETNSYYENMRKERKQNPRFTSEGHGEYRLNNPVNGDIVSLQILGNPMQIKDSSGSYNYFYNAIRQDIFREDDAINLNPNVKPNLQFSLPYKIEDMCQFANDDRYPDNSRGIANMMQNLLNMKGPYHNSLYVGGISFKDGMLVFADDATKKEIIDTYLLQKEEQDRKKGYEDGPNDR